VTAPCLHCAAPAQRCAECECKNGGSECRWIKGAQGSGDCGGRAHNATEEQVDSACLSYRHDFGLLPEGDRNQLRFEAREWLHAWLKEGIGCDRNEVIERCAQVVDQANREGPYEAITSAKRIRALKGVLLSSEGK